MAAPTLLDRPDPPVQIVVTGNPRSIDLARTHAAIWWLHDAADFPGLEAAARELVAAALPDLTDEAVGDCAAGIRACYETYDAAQDCVREWRLTDHPAALDALRAAHRATRLAWWPDAPDPEVEEGYYAFYAHSMWLHTPGWRRPFQKLWRNPARLAGIWRYHQASFPQDRQSAVYPAVRCLFWAGLKGHDYKSRQEAEDWLARYWALLVGRGIRHLFF